MKRIALLAVLLLTIIAGCGKVPALRPESSNLPDGSITVPMRIVANRPYVEVSLNGKGPYTFLLDTGCTSVIVSQRVSEELDLKEWQTDRLRMQGNATEQIKTQTTWARLENLKLVEFELKQFDVLVNITGSVIAKSR